MAESKLITEAHDKAAAERGTPSVDELAGPSPSAPMSLEDLFQEGKTEMGRMPLPKLNPTRPEITWEDDDPSGDPRNHQGLPPSERKARWEEHTAAYKAHLAEVEAEMLREEREKANLPFKMAEQRLEMRRAWEAGERAKAEAAEAEEDRLAQLAGESIPEDPNEYANAAWASLRKHHRDIADDFEITDVEAAAGRALQEYVKDHPGKRPTPKHFARLTAKQLRADAEENDFEDASMVDGIGGGSGIPSRGIVKTQKDKGEEKGTDMFDELRAFQRRAGII
jgi:hypothetical protein